MNSTQYKKGFEAGSKGLDYDPPKANLSDINEYHEGYLDGDSSTFEFGYAD